MFKLNRQLHAFLTVLLFLGTIWAAQIGGIWTIQSGFPVTPTVGGTDRSGTGGGFTPPSPGGTAPGAGAGGQVAAAPQTDAEVPSLILWHWKDPRPQAQQQVQEAQDKAFSYQAVYHVAQGKVVQLTDARMRVTSS